MKRLLFNIGVFFLIGGSFLVISSSGISGFAIFEGEKADYVSLSGIIAALVGIALIITSREEESQLVGIVRTPTFERAIKRHDLRKIDAAIRKIQLGLGKAHQLKGGRSGEHAIRTDYTGRIIYHYDAEGNIILTDYTSTHRY